MSNRWVDKERLIDKVDVSIYEKYDEHSCKANSWDLWSGKLLAYQQKQDIWNSSGPENLGLRVAIETLLGALQAVIFPSAFHLMLMLCEIKFISTKQASCWW